MSLIGFGSVSYKYGSTLSTRQVYNIVYDSVSSGTLPLDESGVYFVLTSSDVQQYDDPKYGFCTTGSSSGYCGWHSYGSMLRKKIKYSFVGNPENCQICDAQRVGPNENWAADAMVSVIAHELAETVTDPEFTAWYDADGEENADKCAWTYGNTFLLSNGARWNVQFGEKKWLIQRNLLINSLCSVSST